MIAGSVNGAGAVKFKATCVGGETTLARIAKLVETAQNSSHPLAVAILAEAEQRKLPSTAQVKDFQNVAGHGLQEIIDGKNVLTGDVSLFADKKVALDPIHKGIDQQLAAGQTMILLAVDGKAAAVVGVTDPIKPSAKRAVAELKKLGIKTAMVSGDNKAVAERVGKEISIDRVFAEVLPGNKADYVKKFQGEGVFYHSRGWSLRPEVSALLMSAWSIIVAINAMMLRRSEKLMLT